MCQRHDVRILLLILVTAACSKTSGDGGACPPLRVTANGAALPAMPNGLAFSHRVNGAVTWHVDRSDRAKTCEQYMGKDGRILESGEQSVSASTGVLRAVGIRNELVAHDKVELVGAAPSKPGETLVLCVADASFTSSADSYEGKTIVMSGRFEGTYCGEQSK
jgi:hypothetical protein